MFSAQRSETRSISIDAAPDTVFHLVSDPRQLPTWAPSFACSVNPHGTDWLIDDGLAERIITVRASHKYGTVDVLAATDHRRGAFTRVLPNGDGSEFTFTLFFPDDAPQDAIAAQMAVVEQELQTVRALCEDAKGIGSRGV